MVKTTLVEALIEDGAKLLRRLDREQFPVDAMFWIFLLEEGYWRLVIASSLVSRKGSLVGYDRLIEIMGELETARLTPEDIYLLAPEYPQYQSFRKALNATSGLAAGPAWLEFDESVVYRWTDASVSATLSCDVSARDLKRLWENRRKTAGRKRILISKNNGLFTLRLHPVCGPIDHIDGLKPIFDMVLREARPDCHLTWR